jgi:hypothetical protein
MSVRFPTFVRVCGDGVGVVAVVVGVGVTTAFAAEMEIGF